MPDERENQFTKDLLQQAEEQTQTEMEQEGLDQGYNLWRESLDERIPDQAVKDKWLWSVDAETEAVNGGLSVVLGTEGEEGVGTTPPIPGPDDEGTRPDEAGEVSEGGDRPAPDQKLMQMVWEPPPESQMEGFEPPKTRDIVKSDEWIENAWKFYKFMGEPKLELGGPAKGTPGYEEYAAEYRAKYPLVDSEIADWAKREISLFNWNLMQTGSVAQKVMSADDPESAIAFLNLLNMYDYSDGGAAEFWGAVGGIMTDPTTYLGLGVGSAVSKGAAKTLGKTQLKKAIQFAIQGATAGTVEGGLLAGGFDLTKQNIEQEAKVREDLDYGRAAGAAGIGAGLGMALGGFGGHIAGRYADKFDVALEKEMAKQLFGQTRAARVREATENGLNSDQMMEMIEASQRASALAGVRDDFAEMAMRLLTDEDSMPRLENGEPDVDAITKILDDIVAEREARAAKAKEDIAAQEATLGRRSADEAANEVIPFDEDIANAMDPGPDNLSFEIRHGETLDADEAVHVAQSIEDDLSLMADSYGLQGKYELERISDGAQDVTVIKFADEADADAFYQAAKGKPRKKAEPLEPVPTEESRRLAEQIAEMAELEAEGLVHAAPGRKGSIIQDENGIQYELIGRTKNGWYKGRPVTGTGEEKNFRRAQFTVSEVAPSPRWAGIDDLSPFSRDAARIIDLAESVTSRPVNRAKATHKEQQKIADLLQKDGVDITAKQMAVFWTPAELLYLRNTYNAMARQLADFIRKVDTHMANGGKLPDTDLAFFNAAHTKFVAVRDLFFGVRGNAARMLNVLRSRPKDQQYDFSQMLIDTIATQGGRAQTERAIRLMAEQVKLNGDKGIDKASQRIWGTQTAQAILNVRYNFMLSSWRTHFFNFLGNSASGIYEHLLVSPVKMAINNAEYASKLAMSFATGRKPDPAERLTMQSWKSELMAHKSAFRDSLVLAKEIALGRDIGEGKVWNELGLRYDVVNVPDTMFGKLGTTPVRMLEAGDAFFKNQYFNSKLHFLAERKARADAIHHGADFQTRYHEILDNPTPAMEKEAREFAAKMTYTNDPNVYGGILASLARGAQTLQSGNLAFNMLIPFVRTPANLLSYSMEMIGANAFLSPAQTWKALNSTNQLERQEAMAKFLTAAGLWIWVHDKYQNGEITGAGPANYEERKTWEASGWQANSYQVMGKWVDMSRAAPVGQALSTIATVFDYVTLADQDAPPLEWIGAGLLFTADMVKDESFLSTITDMIVVIESKEEARGRAIAASTINSILVPNALRDVRRVTDETMRSGSSPNLLTQVTKQMQNAVPGLSEGLAPQRDWRGQPKNYFGNAYVRGLVPFQVKDPSQQDAASMAVAYARIPITTPSRKFAITDRDLSIDLMAMDNGRGLVYDKYLEFVGKARYDMVNRLIETGAWKKLIADGETGPGSYGETQLRGVLAKGTRIGKAQFLQFLIDRESFDTPDGRTIYINHPVSRDEYRNMAIRVMKDREQVPEDKPQFEFKEREEGPEFFKP